MKIDSVFLRSRVARRVFLLFVLCALLPLTALAVISYTHVTNQLQEQSQKRLRQASKAFGMAVYERLLLLEAELKLISSRAQSDARADIKGSVKGIEEDLATRYNGLALRTRAGSSLGLFGRMQNPPVPTAAETQHISAGKTLVSSQMRPDGHARVFMTRALEGPGRGRLLAEIKPAYLWGLRQEGALPHLTEMCMVAHPVEVLICSFGDARAFSKQLSPIVVPSGPAHFEWQHAGEEYLASFWSIPLKFRFSSPTWTVVLSEPRALALEPMANFRHTFPIVILLSLSVVGLLSLNQIRRSLVPLERLQEGTRRIANKDFTSRVTVESRDEFEELAGSFNAMASQLGRQFHTLETIAEIDRAVLSALETNKIVDTVLARIREVFPSECASVTLRDPDKKELAWTYLRGGSPEDDRVVEGVELTLTEMQALHEHPDHLFVEGRDIPRFLGPLTKRGVTACLVLPLFRSDRLSGFITLGYRRNPEHTQEDLAQARQVANQVAAALANAHDIAERKRAEELLQHSNRSLEEALVELKATQKQMVQQERLRALGQMASGVAHDFNNTLSPIVGFSELLLLSPKKLDDKEKLKEHLRIINTAARDAAKVVSRLRDFYRPREREDVSASVNLNQLVEQTIRLTQPKWKDQALANGIRINVEADAQEVQPVGGNESELREVLTNLVFNAVDALAESGTITLRTRQEGEHVMVEVSDTGAGMTEEVRQRCLEPFFSTKGDRGTGLGLSMVYGIIRRHQGTLDVESEPGRGTTFRIRLPVQREPGVQAQSPESQELATGLHVLAVDDDELVCRVTVEYLTSLGNTVETAGNGAEALTKFRAGRFDLVVTDQGMPEMNGDQLASAIKRIAPNTPVVLLTGDEKMADGADEPAEGVDFILTKPLTMAALRHLLIKLHARGGSLQGKANAVSGRL